MSNEDKASRVTRCRYSKVNTLFATLNNTLLGYNIFPGHLNGDVYHQFLTNQLFQILEDIPLAVRQRLWYMQDGAPPHSTRECLRWMHEHFPNRCPDSLASKVSRPKCFRFYCKGSNEVQSICYSTR